MMISADTIVIGKVKSGEMDAVKKGAGGCPCPDAAEL